MSKHARTAVVAGASSGIGAAVADALAAAGFRVHLLARRGDLLADVAQRTMGTYDVVDVVDERQLERARTKLAESSATVEILVYAAGVLDVHDVDGHPTELWRRTIDVNLTGAFFATRAFLPLLAPGARIVFVSSTAGRKGLPHLAAYSASKGGLNLFAEALAAELEPRGIGVHVVEPGPVATPLLDRPGTSPFQLDPEQVGEVIAWLAQLPADVVLRDVRMRAPTKGPFARPRHQRGVLTDPPSAASAARGTPQDPHEHQDDPSAAES
jgi:NAD(P)-dependent dehydrogenase (short-subunit alcohol dehydrogenase family)